MIACEKQTSHERDSRSIYSYIRNISLNFECASTFTLHTSYSYSLGVHSFAHDQT